MKTTSASKERLKHLTLSATLTAIVTVATIIVQIPSPMNGYVNLGDCFVLLSAWMLGPVYGSVAAALGSALADLITGYAIYAPGTFVIKGLMALAAWSVLKLFVSRRAEASRISYRIVSALTAEIIMTVGYFLYSAIIFGEGLAAALSIPANLMQGLIGCVSSVTLAVILRKTGIMK
ncbi:MAG: ECF transporter S component [Ruminococcaceae bacterium]|nr:ECF transporter S component [Oscillospiraceae bacterium]